MRTVAGLDTWPPERARGNSDDGSIVPLLAVVVLIVMLSGLLVGLTAERHRRHAGAQWAADAAALAAAAGGVDQTGPASARGIAEANGARLVSMSTYRPPALLGPDVVSTVVVIRVEFGGVTASAAAARFIDNRNRSTTARSERFVVSEPK